MVVALEFFGGLRTGSDTVMAEFSDADLGVVRQFLTRMSDVLAEHREQFAGPD